MKGFFLLLYFSFLLHPLQAHSKLIASGKESSLSESKKKDVFRAFVLQMWQFIKEILLEAYEANKRWIFLPWMEDSWSSDTERKTSEGPGEGNPVLGESGRGKISGRAPWCWVSVYRTVGQLLRYFHALAGLEGSRITSGPSGHNFKDRWSADTGSFRLPVTCLGTM